MEISRRLQPQTTTLSLPAAELDLGKRILTTNLALDAAEHILIVTDENLHDAAEIWLAAASSLGNSVELIVVSGMRHSGEEPPVELEPARNRADLLLLQTSFSLTHTNFSKTSTREGKRVATLPGVNKALMLRTLSLDYDQIRQTGQKLQQTLASASEMTITSALGTELRTRVRSNLVIDDNGFIGQGKIGNLPGGEVFFSPLENTTEGLWVINGSLADDELDEPVTLEIKAGRVISISGGRSAQKLETLLNQVGPDAFEVAEIGIGTNPAADAYGALIEAEKAYGTAHLAVGNSLGFGGRNSSPVHIDGLTVEPTITVDGQEILHQLIFKL